MAKITITVSGHAGTGKSTVVRDIIDLLTGYGYQVDSGEDLYSEVAYALTRPRTLQAQVRAVLFGRLKRKELTIEVVELQLKKAPNP